MAATAATLLALATARRKDQRPEADVLTGQLADPRNGVGGWAVHFKARALRPRRRS